MQPPADADAPSAASPSRPALWREADADGRRELIVEVALSLLHEDGLEAVTMRRVAGQLGVGAMTLYTYLENQGELRVAMVRRGFEMLHDFCHGRSTLESDASWRGGSKAYVEFAIANPNLYRLMFDAPVDCFEEELIRGGFSTLHEKVAKFLAAQGLEGEELDLVARRAAGRYWIALHGIASLAIADRLTVLRSNVDDLIDDMLQRVAPGQ